MLDAKDDLLRPRPLEILALLPIAASVGAFIGAIVDASNNWIYPPPFFIQTRNPNDAHNFVVFILMAAIKRGMNIGCVSGVVLSTLLVVGLVLISKLRCSFRLGLSVQAKTIGFTLLFWLVGGLNGALIAAVRPVSSAYYMGLNRSDPKVILIGWIFGSYYGICFGSILSTIGVLSSFARKWRQLEKQVQI